MSEYEFTLRRVGIAIIALAGFVVFPIGGTAAQLAKWCIEKRDAIR